MRKPRFQPAIRNLAAGRAGFHVISMKRSPSRRLISVLIRAMESTPNGAEDFRFYCKVATDRNRCQSHWGLTPVPKGKNNISPLVSDR